MALFLKAEEDGEGGAATRTGDETIHCRCYRHEVVHGLGKSGLCGVCILLDLHSSGAHWLMIIGLGVAILLKGPETRLMVQNLGFITLLFLIGELPPNSRLTGGDLLRVFLLRLIGRFNFPHVFFF